MASSHVFVLGGLAESLTNFRGPLLREFRNRNLRVTVAAGGPAPDDVARKLADWGVEYVSVPLERAGLNPVKDFSTVTSLVSLFRQKKPDVFFGYTIKPVVYGLIAARLAGIPRRSAMLTGLGYAFTDGRERSLVGRIAKTLLRSAVSLSHMTIFQNHDDLEFMRGSGVVSEAAPTGLVDGSGVDLEQYAAAPLPEGPPTFLLIARLLRDKGISEYVEAARIVKTAFPSARFRLAGPFDPNPAAISKAEVEAWEREGVVEYLGPLADVRPALGACHVYVLPSYREGTPRTVLEAMATGRAIITTDAPGCRQTVVDGDNGFLVPVQDPRAIADRMLRYCAAPELIEKCANSSRKIVSAKFEAREVARKTADLILGSGRDVAASSERHASA